MMHLCSVLTLLAILTLVSTMQRTLLTRNHPLLQRHAFRTSRFHGASSALDVEKSKTNGFGSPKFYSDNSLRYVLDKQSLSGLPDRTRPFTVLGIESSCDDTGVAIVRSDGTILSQVVYSQNAIHEKFGGIVPTLAMEQHKLNIDVAVAEALEKAGMQSANEVDAIAVTKGPGLEICLRVGLRKAQAIATEYSKPFVTVHHLEAHCMLARLAGQVPQLSTAVSSAGASKTCATSCSCSNNVHSVHLLDSSNSPKHEQNKPVTATATSTVESEPPHFTPKVSFPFLVLLASGGHTSLLLCTGIGEYTVLGGTLDDALGEAFDKAARLLGLRGASSGGVAIEQAAARYRANCAHNAAAAAAVSVAADVGDGSKDDLTEGSTVVSGGTMNSESHADADGIADADGSGSGSGVGGVGAAEEGAVEQRSGLNVPMRNKANCDFSYAGLKTSFRKAVERARLAQGYGQSNLTASNAPVREMTEAPSPVTLPDDVTGKLCEDFQHTAFSHVEDRLKRALDYVDHQSIPVTALVVVGGVAANGELRRRLWALLQLRAEKHRHNQQPCTSTATTSSTPTSTISTDIALVFPPPSLCTDNGVMVAWTGIEKLCRGYSDPIEGQSVVPRWPMGTPLSPQDKEVLGHLKKYAGKSKGDRRSERQKEKAAVEKLLSESTLL